MMAWNEDMQMSMEDPQITNEQICFDSYFGRNLGMQHNHEYVTPFWLLGTTKRRIPFIVPFKDRWCMQHCRKQPAFGFRTLISHNATTKWSVEMVSGWGELALREVLEHLPQKENEGKTTTFEWLSAHQANLSCNSDSGCRLQRFRGLWDGPGIGQVIIRMKEFWLCILYVCNMIWLHLSVGTV